MANCNQHMSQLGVVIPLGNASENAQPSTKWKELAAPYVVKALELGDTSFCERCQELHLEDKLERRIPILLGNDKFDIERSLSPSSCSFCALVQSLIQGDSFGGVWHVHPLSGSVSTFLWNRHEPGYQLIPSASFIERPCRWPSDPANLDWRVLGECISLCRKTHRQTCFPVQRLPVRNFKLFNCKTGKLEDGDADYTYVALSYVWGQSPCSETSHTIEDAKRVVLILGYTYLWIDQVCIDQEDNEHKLGQIQQMDRIYHNADLTIIAAAGNSSDHGLPGIGGPHRPSQKFMKVGEHVLLQNLVVEGNGSLRTCPWESRAWTLQEEVLSRRRLYFGRNMAWFSCNAARDNPCVFESDQMPLPQYQRQDVVVHHDGDEEDEQDEQDEEDEEENEHIYAPLSLNGRINLFYQLLRRYTCRNLSYASDILNAFTGILRFFETAEGAWKSIWGVPFIQMSLIREDGTSALPGGVSFVGLSGLRWREYQYPVSLSQTLHVKRRPGFPSWSWAGWNTVVTSSPSVRYEVPTSLDVELADGTVISWTEFDRISRTQGQPEVSPFIHMEIFATQVTFYPCNLSEYDGILITHKVVLETTDGQEHCIPIDNRYHSSALHKEGWTEASSLKLTALIVVDLEEWYDKMMIFVEERQGENTDDTWFERIGYLSLGIGSGSLPSLEDLKLEKRRFRLG